MQIFGMLPRDYEIVLKAVELKNMVTLMFYQSKIQMREKEPIKFKKLLADSSLSKIISVAMQSVDPHTLKSIKRDNISIEDYQELQRRFTKGWYTDIY